MDVDTTQLRALAFDLGKTEAKVFPKIRAIVQKTMLDTKNEMKAEAAGSGIAEAKALSGFISYETKETPGGVSAVVGPTTGGPGSFAFLYFGNKNNGPVLKDPLFAMQRNAKLAEPFFVKALRGDL
jgi:hypothetical protein